MSMKAKYDSEIAPALKEKLGLKNPMTIPRVTKVVLNMGTGVVDWTAAVTQPWLSLSSVGGQLAPGISTTVDVCVTADADLLTPGSYSDAVTFMNVMSGNTQERAITLTVGDLNPPTASPQQVMIPKNMPAIIHLQATDDGQPNPPGAMTYT